MQITFNLWAAVDRLDIQTAQEATHMIFIFKSNPQWHSQLFELLGLYNTFKYFNRRGLKITS